MRRIACGFALVLAVAAMPRIAFAQASGIAGVVKDASGAVMPGVTVEARPTSKNWSTIGVMTIGVSSNQNDVGGSAGEHQNQLKAHGGSFNDRIVQMDGIMNANMACNYSCTGISTNDQSTQELSYEFGAISAEVAGGGVRVNIIPKDGGNRLRGSAFGNFANDKMQGNNVDQTLRDQGEIGRA